ncbi:MAG: MFS transporter [Bauldia sp.]
MATQDTTRPAIVRSIPLILGAGSLIAVLSFGPRSTMGFFLTPMTSEYGWSRETFAFAIALQNLVWGIGQPFVGMVADKFGTARVLSVGALFYALGLALMSVTTDPLALQFTAGVLIGLGIAGSAFLLVLAAFARLLPQETRTLGYGIGTAAGSVGQFIFAPLGQGFISAYGWHTALLLMALTVLAIPFLSYVVRGKPASSAPAGQREQSMIEALREAFGHNSYRLLVAGFFVCGFQIAFITVHLPPYLSDIGIPAIYGAYAIGLIGLFNIFGAFTSGFLTGRVAQKRMILVWLYLARAAVIAAFILLPPSIPSVLIFSALMGFMWLSTIPPTQQLVVAMFGTRYLATLFGFVFFSHQVGSFFGVWLGGVLYDRTGSYDVVWWISVALGVFAAAVNFPISEKAVGRGGDTAAAPAGGGY